MLLQPPPRQKQPRLHRAFRQRQQTRNVDDAKPAPFVPGTSPSEVAWLLDEASRDFLGNEYLLWLWFMLDSEADVIPLGDLWDVVAHGDEAFTDVMRVNFQNAKYL